MALQDSQLDGMLASEIICVQSPRPCLSEHSLIAHDNRSESKVLKWKSPNITRPDSSSNRPVCSPQLLCRPTIPISHTPRLRFSGEKRRSPPHACFFGRLADNTTAHGPPLSSPIRTSPSGSSSSSSKPPCRSLPPPYQLFT